jgi:hypothetical protein
MASMTYYSEIGLVARARFVTWQCCIAGFAVSGVRFGSVIARGLAGLVSSVWVWRHRQPLGEIDEARR